MGPECGYPMGPVGNDRPSESFADHVLPTGSSKVGCVMTCL